MDRITAKTKAEDLVGKMTVEEAASQLRFDAPAIPRLGVPAYNWWNEALHGLARSGTATSFPQEIALAACFDPELIEKIGDVAATEGRARYNSSTAKEDRDIYKGLTFWSPNVNIFRDPRWGRGQETYGEDPLLTCENGKAFVRGLQGNGKHMKTAACAKHYAVHSGPEALRHEFDAVASPKDMEETYLPAFKALVTEAGVEAVMGAYNRTNGEPCCGSKTLLVDKLRKEWNFQGHIVSDCWAVRDFHERHKVTSCPEESVRLALETGCDLNCGCTYQHVVSAWKKGLIKEEVIRRSAVRLFTTRYLLGMFEQTEYDGLSVMDLDTKEHRELARKAAEKSLVLLKNNGILPLAKNRLKTVAVIGPNANSRLSLIGNYHGTASRYITVLEGLQDALGDEVRVLYSEGCDIRKDRVEPHALDHDRISEAVSMCEAADVTVLVVGLNENLEGEEGDEGNSYVSGDKDDLRLPSPQRKLMEAVLAAGKPTVIVLMAGSSIDLGPDAEKADAVLLGWYPGAGGGQTIADILLGNVSPSGKLPVTFYYNDDLEKMPAFEDYSMKNRTYRYIDFEPLYPFGYGLTYGDCLVEKAAATRKEPEGPVEITAEVSNQGARDTEEVLQVYAANEGSTHAPRNPRLVGFLRFSCKAGQSVKLSLSVPAKRLQVIDDEGREVSEGKPVLYAGLGQPDARTERLTGHKAIKICL